MSEWQLVPASDHPEDDSGSWQIFRRVDGKDQFFGGFDIKENLVDDVAYLNALEARAEQAEAHMQNANAQRDYWQRAAQTSAEASRVRFQEKRQSEARATGWQQQWTIAEHRAEQAGAELSELRKRVEAISMDLIKTHNRVLELETERDSK